MLHFTRVEFNRFKAFKAFAIELRHFNILVGPNNSGKSTILAAFRILAAGMRKATSRRPTLIRGPQGRVLGYDVDLRTISVAEENIFYNYADDDTASVTFNLSNKNTLTLYFPEQGICYLIPDANGKSFATPTHFKNQFDCPIGFVPILGPVEHHEPLYEKEAARLALFNYRAARNFRNIWHHYPDKFEGFRAALAQSWPGMDIERPEIDMSWEKPRLHMYCPEDRTPRELFWAGFGFQVWCQMLTHIIQSTDVSLFLIDEPDIYLHSDLQRQLLGILRNFGPDVLLATHSTEIIMEAETDDILLINKNYRAARRIRDPSQLEEVFGVLGSNLNPVLTQLAKTRRVLFVEGKDFHILGKFARKLGKNGVGNRRDFAVVPVDGFNPERIKNLKAGMETTLGTSIVAAAVLDGDFRCDAERQMVTSECKDFCDFVAIHERKEIENFLLVPTAIDRAISNRIADRARRVPDSTTFSPCAVDALTAYCDSKKHYVVSQALAERRRFDRGRATKLHETEISEEELDLFEERWGDLEGRLSLVPGKDALGAVNKVVQERFSVSITPTTIIDAMRVDEIPVEMKSLVDLLTEFASQSAAKMAA